MLQCSALVTIYFTVYYSSYILEAIMYSTFKTYPVAFNIFFILLSSNFLSFDFYFDRYLYTLDRMNVVQQPDQTLEIS